MAPHAKVVHPDGFALQVGATRPPVDKEKARQIGEDLPGSNSWTTSRCKLPRAIPPPLHTRRHGAHIVRSVLRHLARLLLRPLLAFGFVGGLLLGGLAVLRVHEDLA